jgi:hypothetical protein
MFFHIAVFFCYASFFWFFGGIHRSSRAIFADSRFLFDGTLSNVMALWRVNRIGAYTDSVFTFRLHPPFFCQCAERKAHFHFFELDGILCGDAWKLSP